MSHAAESHLQSKPVQSDHRYAPDRDGHRRSMSDPRYLTPNVTVYPPAGGGR